MGLTVKKMQTSGLEYINPFPHRWNNGVNMVKAYNFNFALQKYK